MAHVQLTGNVGWGHHNGEGLFAFVLLRMEVAAVLPHLVDTGLDLLRLVGLG